MIIGDSIYFTPANPSASTLQPGQSDNHLYNLPELSPIKHQPMVAPENNVTT